MIDLEKLPLEIRDHVQNDIAKYGEWATNHFLHLAPLIRMISDLKSTDTDIVWLTVVLHAINFYGSKDPSPVHFALAREYLEEKGIASNRAVDLLARALVTYCQKVHQSFSTSFAKEGQGWINLSLSDERGYFLPGTDCLPKFICEKDDSNLIDIIFAKFLQTIGKVGISTASAILESASTRFLAYKKSGYQSEHRPGAWSLWLKTGPTATVFSPFLSVLADVIWQDICETNWEREAKNVPALTQGIHPSITKILSTKAEAKEIENHLYMVHDGKVIANIPTIDPKLIPSVTKGAHSLNSIYHHKLIRFECRAGFENWASGKADVRLLRFERGCLEIAERLGFTSNKAIEEIKSILHAQAYMHFLFEDGSSGNLIILNKFHSPGSGRDDGIMITLGPQLLPHYTFQTTSKRHHLLIPLPDLPPLIASTNSHAGQAALQMLVMEEFSDCSIELAENGFIEISKEKWEYLAKESGLPPSIFRQTLDRWLNDGDDGPCFLIEYEKNRYAFGPSFQKEEEFLKRQGSIRKRRKSDGEKSAAARKRKQCK